MLSANVSVDVMVCKILNSLDPMLFEDYDLIGYSVCSILASIHTVKPVYRGHPRNRKILAFMYRSNHYRNYTVLFKGTVVGWPLYRQELFNMF